MSTQFVVQPPPNLQLLQSRAQLIVWSVDSLWWSNRFYYGFPPDDGRRRSDVVWRWAGLLEVPTGSVPCDPWGGPVIYTYNTGPTLRRLFDLADRQGKDGMELLAFAFSHVVLQRAPRGGLVHIPVNDWKVWRTLLKGIRHESGDTA